MKISKKLKALAAVISIAAAVIAAPAMANPITPPACKITDLPGSTSCIGIFSGNIEIPEANPFFYGDLILPTAFNSNFGDYTTWTLLAYDSKKSGSDSNFLQGGNWSLNLGGATELVIAIKQGNAWGAWYFSSPVASGDWTTSWQGDGSGYSHGFALVRGVTTDQHDVPEPATLGLLGLGLLGAGIARRRRA